MKLTNKQKKAALKLWWNGRNIWEISQIIGVPESVVQEFIHGN